MQCKDIPDFPILAFLNGLNGKWANWFGDKFPNSVTNAMPGGTPGKLALAKMRGLIRRGLVNGCCCGCRGDFVLTDKGKAVVGSVYVIDPQGHGERRDQNGILLGGKVA